MKKIIILLVFTLSLFGGDLNWSHDYDESVEKAQEQKKGVYVLITSDYCKWCKKFEKSTAVDKDILKKLNKNYVLVHLSRERHDIPASLKTRPVPIHHFLNNDEKIVYSTIGYMEANDFSKHIDKATKKINR